MADEYNPEALEEEEDPVDDFEVGWLEGGGGRHGAPLVLRRSAKTSPSVLRCAPARAPHNNNAGETSAHHPSLSLTPPPCVRAIK